ncbi:hypothetical protein [Brucella pseudogrignonensis]|uniref:Sialate O-acetylesterase domain-containing protein n=1 Tax=Brucella pseudogrignonensis TaxID=419475 RepID=A0ABU1M5I7_9HYPH|nr:hypothetical protein [Brucella pseudogrignonensis]MDR6431308.1 hypothetical protein [Brucella pseudogrignonensis]
MAVEKTQHYEIGKPVPANNISEDVSVLRGAFDLIDFILFTLAQALLEKMDKTATFEMSAVSGLVEALAQKMPANRTFKLTELTDISGAASAIDNYILTKSEAGFVFRSALAVLGRHLHNIDDVEGLQNILNTLVSGAAASIDGEIVVFEGSTGKHTKRSGETLSSLMSNVATRDFVANAIATSGGGGGGGGGKYFDTKAQADAAIASIPIDTGVNVIVDGANNGFYVNQGGVLVKKSNATIRQMTDIDDLVRNTLVKMVISQDAFTFVDKFKGLLGSILLDGTLKFRGLDIKHSGALSEIKTSKDIVEVLGVPIERGSAEGRIFTILDKKGNVILHAGPKGVYFFGDRVQAIDFTAGKEGANTPIVVKGSKLSIKGTSVLEMDGNGIGVVDKYGFFTLYSGIYGNYLFTEKDKDQSSPSPSAENVFSPSSVLGFQTNTDIKGCIDDGQSLSRGAQALPTISTVQPYLNITLVGGNKARFGADSRYNATSFIPLVEETLSSEGETPLSGCLNGVVRRAIADGAQASDYVFFGAATGAGGRTVYQLSQDDPDSWFSRKIKLITDANALAVSQGKTFSIWSVLWYQGENDYSASSLDTQPNHYQARFLTALWYPLVSHIKKTTGQKFDPYVFSYQVAAHRRYNRDHMQIALAQWRMSRSLPFFCMVAPCYIFPVAADNLHLTNTGSWLMGEYTARAKFQTMVRRSGKYRPLEPERVEWSGNSVKIKYHVPQGAISFDSSWVSQADNQGFGIRGPADEYISNAITGVAITGSDEVTISLRAGLPVNLTLTYGRGKPGDPAHSGPITGARGNLRDNAGEYDRVYHPVTGEEFKLHNYSLMFQHNQINGF